MYYQLKSDIIFRNYKDFGLITDNRNFAYRKQNDTNKPIGDKILSDTGAVFLSVLTTQPQSIKKIVHKILTRIPDVEFNTIYNDAKEFYDLLVQERFLASGVTQLKCRQNDTNTYTQTLYKNKVLHTNEPKITIDTQDFLDNRFDKEPQLRNIHIEITSICNERCVHCYIPHEYKNNYMDFSLFKRIVRESKNMNVLNFTLTGGEPMLHPQFIEIIKLCKRENFSLNILSNLTVINEHIIHELKSNPLINVQASLYSVTPEIHDAITKMKGSCNLTKTAIKKSVKNNINLQICCPIIQQNKDCYQEVIKWAHEMNINTISDYIIMGKYNSEIDNLNCRLSIDDIEYVMNRDPYYNYNNLIKEIEEKKSLTPEDSICSVCRYSLCISETGNVYPCAGWQSNILGNLHNTRIQTIWNKSEKIKCLRKIQIKDFKACAVCKDRIYCSICMVRNANENPEGDPMIISKYHCNLARLKREIYKKYMN